MLPGRYSADQCVKELTTKTYEMELGNENILLQRYDPLSKLNSIELKIRNFKEKLQIQKERLETIKNENEHLTTKVDDLDACKLQHIPMLSFHNERISESFQIEVRREKAELDMFRQRKAEFATQLCQMNDDIQQFNSKIDNDKKEALQLQSSIEETIQLIMEYEADLRHLYREIEQRCQTYTTVKESLCRIQQLRAEYSRKKDEFELFMEQMSEKFAINPRMAENRPTRDYYQSSNYSPRDEMSCYLTKIEELSELDVKIINLTQRKIELENIRCSNCYLQEILQSKVSEELDLKATVDKMKACIQATRKGKRKRKTKRLPPIDKFKRMSKKKKNSV